MLFRLDEIPNHSRTYLKAVTACIKVIGPGSLDFDLGTHGSKVRESA